MTAALDRYEAARHALAEARRVDEVKDIHDEAAALQEYARRSNDSELIEHATEIRLRARRRLGEMMAAQKAGGLMAKGGGDGSNQHQKATGSDCNPVAIKPITLTEAGIDKHLAHGARKLAAMDDDAFEAHVAVAKKKMVAVVEGGSSDSPMPKFTGDFEWYTPREIIELAVETRWDRC